MEPFVNALVDTLPTPEAVLGLLSSQGGPSSQAPPRPMTTKDQANRTLV